MTCFVLGGVFFNQLSQFKNKPFFLSIINMWFHITESYTSEKSITVIGLIVQNILIKIKLYSGIEATWQLNYTWSIFWAFRQTGKTGKKNQVSNPTSSIWWGLQTNFHSTILRDQSDLVIQFLIWTCTLIKKQRNISIDQHFLIKRNVENHSILHSNHSYIVLILDLVRLYQTVLT